MKKTPFTIAEVMPGKLNAMVKIIMDQMKIKDPNEAVRRMSSYEWIVVKAVPRWYEEDGVIDFTLPTTDGTTGIQWIERYRQKGIKIADNAKSILLSSYFVPTIGVTTKIKVLKGLLFLHDKRSTDNVRASAYAGTFTHGQKLFDPNLEVACLIREMFTDEEIRMMKLSWIVAMHKPSDIDGSSYILGAVQGYDDPRLNAYCVGPDRWWSRGGGFAFVAE